MNGRAPLTIGVLSNTQGRLDRRILDIFGGVARIIHAGGIGSEEVIWALENVAPVIAVRGMADRNTLCYPSERLAVIEETTFYVRQHFSKVEELSPAHQHLIEKRMPDVVVFGQGKRPYAGHWRGTLIFNPGSASSPEDQTASSVGLLELRDGEPAEHRIVNLHDEASWPRRTLA